MKSFPVVQGSTEWQQLRAGRVTASTFDKVITPKTAVLSKSSVTLMYRLLAERILGYALETVSTSAMRAGHELEPEAIAWFEFDRAVETKAVGICFTDDMRVGASPDRFVGEHGLAEFKAPEPQTHVGYILEGFGPSEEYRAQVQGQLWVCERDWSETVSYCRGFPGVIFRVGRDGDYIAKLSKAVTEFADQLDEALQRLLDLGCKLAEPQEVRVAEDWLSKFGVSDADVDAILATKGTA